MHRPNGSWISERRRKLLGTLAAGGILPAIGSARDVAGSYVLWQGEQCVPLVPLSGDVPVEEFYSYQLPSGTWAGDNGSRDDGGPYFSSAGTQELQRSDASLLFLYDGPNGLSLVVVHGSTEPSREGGGSATFTFAGLPEGGEWAVRDDYYIDPETEEPGESNYDRWRIGGTTQTVSWTWGEDGTDGGAFRGLGGDFAVQIEPAFNEAAERLESNYEGRVVEWQVLSGDPANPDRFSLALDQPVTIQPGTCNGAGQQQTTQHQQTEQHQEQTQQQDQEIEQHQEQEVEQEQEYQTEQQQTEQQTERQQTKHERKQQKHERKQQKHEEKKQRKHERKQQKHERKQQKHERKQQKHEKD